MTDPAARSGMNETNPPIVCPVCGVTLKRIGDMSEEEYVAFCRRYESTLGLYEAGFDPAELAAEGDCPACGRSREE